MEEVFLFIVVRGVAPPKGDLAVGQREQSMVGDGYAMGVKAEILECVVGTADPTS